MGFSLYPTAEMPAVNVWAYSVICNMGNAWLGITVTA